MRLTDIDNDSSAELERADRRLANALRKIKQIISRHYAMNPGTGVEELEAVESLVNEAATSVERRVKEAREKQGKPGGKPGDIVI